MRMGLCGLPGWRRARERIVEGMGTGEAAAIAQRAGHPRAERADAEILVEQGEAENERLFLIYWR